MTPTLVDAVIKLNVAASTGQPITLGAYDAKIIATFLTADRQTIDALKKQNTELREGAQLGPIIGLEKILEQDATIQQQATTIERLRDQLENIHDIAVGYDGYGDDVEKLKGLIDELRGIAGKAVNILYCPECGSSDIRYDRSAEVDDGGDEEQVKFCNKCGIQIRQAFDTKEK